MVTVKATSTDGTSNTKDFTINVSDVNEPITVVSDSNVISDTVPENSSGSTLVGVTASATDEDLTDTVSYSLTDSSGGSFKIDSTTGVVTTDAVLDYETHDAKSSFG